MHLLSPVSTKLREGGSWITFHPSVIRPIQLQFKSIALPTLPSHIPLHYNYLRDMGDMFVYVYYLCKSKGGLHINIKLHFYLKILHYNFRFPEGSCPDPRVAVKAEWRCGVCWTARRSQSRSPSYAEILQVCKTVRNWSIRGWRHKAFKD